MFVVASILAGVCAVSMLVLIVAIVNAPSGMEGLWVLFLGIAVVGVHVVLGLPALLLAFATRRHHRSWWIFVYFGLSVVAAAFVLQAMGVFDGPAQAFQRRWHDLHAPGRRAIVQWAAFRRTRRGAGPGSRRGSRPFGRL